MLRFFGWSCCCAAALLIVGCRCVETAGDTPVRRVAAELDAGGTYYGYADGTAALRALADYGDRLSGALLASELPPESRAQLAGIVKSAVLAMSLAGLDGEIASGASSIRLDGGAAGPVRYRNRAALFHGPQNGDGLLWTLGGERNRDLTPEMEAIPADALLAANFTFAPDRLVEAAGRIADNLGLPGSDGPLPAPFRARLRQVLAGMEGVWNVLVLPGDPAEEELPLRVVLSLPDRDGALWNQLAATLPAGSDDNTLTLPPWTGAKSAAAGKIRREAGGRISFFSSRRLADELLGPNLPRLADRPDFASLTADLPRRGTGFFYTPARFGEVISGLLARRLPLMIPVELPTQFFVLSHEPDGWLLSGNSSWDCNGYRLAGSVAPLLLALTADLPNRMTVLRRQTAAREEQRELRLCRERLEALRGALNRYADAHDGRFPEGGAPEAWRELLREKLAGPEQLLCPGARGDIAAPSAEQCGYANCSYVYFGGFRRDSRPDLPLAADWVFNHRGGKFQVLLVNGDIRSFQLDNLTSCRRLVSFLQSEYQYPEADFRRLLKAADTLDRKVLSAPPEEKK